MDRYQLAPYREFARPYYADKDSAHDFSHIERILDRLGTLSKEARQPPRLDHLYCLACFHGLERLLATDRSFRDQATLFLRGLAWTEMDIEEIYLSLSRHLTSPNTVEEEIIYDANCMELLGALGIARAFTTGGARGQSIEKSAEVFEHQFLDRIEFRTPAGKQSGENGRMYAKRFLKQLWNILQPTQCGALATGATRPSFGPAMQYRNAAATDAPVLAQMNQQLIRDEGHRDRMSVIEVEHRMQSWLGSEYQAVLFENEKGVAGYVLYRWEPEWVYVRQFFVRPDRRRQGIGRTAWIWLCENAWREAPQIRLDVLVGNAVGMQFWRSVGFEDYCITMERANQT